MSEHEFGSVRALDVEYLKQIFEERDRLERERIKVIETDILSLRSYVEAILVEKQKALDMASDEREKAASALREAMGRVIAEGDDRLREHIVNQIAQIHEALDASDKLEKERVDAVRTTVEALFAEKQKALDAALTAQKEAVSKAELATDRIAARAAGDQDALRGEMQERLAAVRRELEAATAAQKEAVIKQEQATERRFEGVNEWRAQSADRERSQAEDRAVLSSTFMLREVADAQLNDIRKQIGTLQVERGHTQGTVAGSDKILLYAFQVITFLIAIGAIIAIVTKG